MRRNRFARSVSVLQLANKQTIFDILVRNSILLSLYDASKSNWEVKNVQLYYRSKMSN